ncbi:hypothetical protein IG197_23555 [Aminobacter sp. SR38]|jgi:hypothetical protein|uniref:hypothetical protein n=1 Tax=Aminobacter sp. SR38 TaxID=2774562 RepID=UPI001780C796|nr:hypothetical protein [Aminobacter sp. SR38]QOF70739.1 hypothetical protein IG197_23555 [Aminobacter sp. SR38]
MYRQLLPLKVPTLLAIALSMALLPGQATAKKLPRHPGQVLRKVPDLTNLPSWSASSIAKKGGFALSITGPTDERNEIRPSRRKGYCIVYLIDPYVINQSPKPGFHLFSREGQPKLRVLTKHLRSPNPTEDLCDCSNDGCEMR